MTTVLIVDDDAEVRNAMTRTLQSGGYDAVGMAGAAEAEERIADVSEAERAAVLAIIDVSLGPADAYPDGCAAGRAFVTRWPTLRVLFMTGHDARDLETRCPGHPPYLLKPIGREDLLALVALMLRAPPWRPLPASDHRRKGDR